MKRKSTAVDRTAAVRRTVLLLIVPGIAAVALATAASAQTSRPAAASGPRAQTSPAAATTQPAGESAKAVKRYQLYTDPVGILLIVYSAVLVALLIERTLAWIGLRSATASAARQTQQLLGATPERQTLTEAFGRIEAPIGRVMSYVLKHDVTNSPEATQLLLEDALDNAHKRLRRNHVLLSAIAGTAPFLGLLGTVRGIMNTFTSIMEQGFGGPAVISAGIAEALQTTAVGLMIAIPAFVALKLFGKFADDGVLELRSQATRIFVALGDF